MITIEDHLDIIATEAAVATLEYEAQRRANEPVAKAFEVLKQAMHDDFEFAWSWHCNIAMAFYDELGPLITPSGTSHEVANRAAARFMKLCFDVDTSQNAATKQHLNSPEALT